MGRRARANLRPPSLTSDCSARAYSRHVLWWRRRRQRRRARATPYECVHPTTCLLGDTPPPSLTAWPLARLLVCASAIRYFLRATTRSRIVVRPPASVAFCCVARARARRRRRRRLVVIHFCRRLYATTRADANSRAAAENLSEREPSSLSALARGRLRRRLIATAIVRKLLCVGLLEGERKLAVATRAAVYLARRSRVALCARSLAFSPTAQVFVYDTKHSMAYRVEGDEWRDLAASKRNAGGERAASHKGKNKQQKK